MASDKYTRCPTCGKQTKLEIWLNGEKCILNDYTMGYWSGYQDGVSMVGCNIFDYLETVNIPQEIKDEILELTENEPLSEIIPRYKITLAEEPTVQVNTEGE